jgi:hypothetical protein
VHRPTFFKKKLGRSSACQPFIKVEKRLQDTEYKSKKVTTHPNTKQHKTKQKKAQQKNSHFLADSREHDNGNCKRSLTGR